MSIHPTEIINYKAELINRIQDMVTPHLHESGFRHGNLKDSRPVMLFHFGFEEDKDGDRVAFCRELGEDIEFEGFIEDGIILDCAGGGLSYMKYSGMFLEQLMELVDIVPQVDFSA